MDAASAPGAASLTSVLLLSTTVKVLTIEDDARGLSDNRVYTPPKFLAQKPPCYQSGDPILSTVLSLWSRSPASNSAPYQPG